MARVAVKDCSQDPPRVLVEYELRNDVAVALVGGESAYVEDLEDDGVTLTLPDGREKVVFPEDGGEFMEALFWELNRKHGFVSACGMDAEGRKIGGRYLARLKKRLAEARKRNSGNTR